MRLRLNRDSRCSSSMQICFLRRKIYRRQCVIRQHDHPLPEKVMALPIYIGTPPDRNNILKKNQGPFSKCPFSQQEHQILPTGTSNTRRMQPQHLWLFRVGVHHQVLTMWLPHASHLNNKERIREGTLRGCECNKLEPQSWLVVIFCSLFAVLSVQRPNSRDHSLSVC